MENFIEKEVVEFAEKELFSHNMGQGGGNNNHMGFPGNQSNFIGNISNEFKEMGQEGGQHGMGFGHNKGQQEGFGNGMLQQLEGQFTGSNQGGQAGFGRSEGAAMGMLEKVESEFMGSNNRNGYTVDFVLTIEIIIAGHQIGSHKAQGSFDVYSKILTVISSEEASL